MAFVSAWKPGLFLFWQIIQDLKKKLKKNPEQLFLDIDEWKKCAKSH